MDKLFRNLFRNDSVPRPFPTDLPTLRNLICHVVSRCAEEQVIGANASGGVAMVTNLKPARDGAVNEFVSYTVSFLTNAIDVDFAVTACGNVALPKPTRIRESNLRPEMSRKVLDACWHLLTHYLRLKANEVSERVRPSYSWLGLARRLGHFGALGGDRALAACPGAGVM